MKDLAILIAYALIFFILLAAISTTGNYLLELIESAH